MTDESIMPFGEHKGKRLDEVPDVYLLWLYNENKCSGNLREYIADNLDAIKQNVKLNKNYEE